MTAPTQQLIHELLDYDQETGIFTWKKRHPKHFKRGQRDATVWNCKFAGSPADTNEYYGYSSICVMNRKYKSHRIAFIYMTGYCPKEVDHIDGNRKNNAWKNLREVTRSENNKNGSVRVDNKSGLPGVSWCKQRNKWQCYINPLPNKRVSLGLFDSLLEAAAVRLRAEKENSYHPNHGKSK